MIMERVEGSSNIAAIGHNPATRKLRVQFHSGHTYEYEDVSGEKHAALMAADSKGGHLNAHIVKGGQHPHRKI